MGAARVEREGEAGIVTRERIIKQEILLALGSDRVRLFNNPVGHAVRPDGSHISYGLCLGSSDLIGWRTVEVTPDMVGRRVAVFVACEVKGPMGRVSREQEMFLSAVRLAGGIGAVARSAETAADLILGEVGA